MAGQISVLLNAIRDKIAVRRLLAFVITLVALLFGAHGGAPRARVLIFSTIFLVASTIWVRGQYDDDLRGRSWFLPGWLGWGCVGVGLVMVGIWHFGDADGLGLYGAIAIYFGSGAVLMRWRDTVLQERGKWLRIASALVISGVLMYFVGAVLLGHAPALVGGLLIVVAVFGTYPVGLSGLSALAIAWLAESDARLDKWGRRGGLAALAVFVVLTAVAVAISHSPWLLLVMGILGLLMVAQASATQADIVAIVAVLALMGVTPAAVSGPAEPTGTRGQSVLVALGDSYMSGEGASVYYSGTDDGGGDQCRRSPTSWAAMASHQPPFTGLQDLACSGATTLNVNHKTAAKPPGVPASEHVVQAGEAGTQLDQFDAISADYAKRNVTSQPALVAVTLGGNDAGFSTVGIMCAAPGGCEEKQKLWLDSLSEVKTQLEATYAAIDQEFPSTPVVVTGYPDPIEKRDTCGDLALTKPERDFIREFVGRARRCRPGGGRRPRLLLPRGHEGRLGQRAPAALRPVERRPTGHQLHRPAVGQRAAGATVQPDALGPQQLPPQRARARRDVADVRAVAGRDATARHRGTGAPTRLASGPLPHPRGHHPVQRLHKRQRWLSPARELVGAAEVGRRSGHRRSTHPDRGVGRVVGQCGVLRLAPPGLVGDRDDGDVNGRSVAGGAG